MRRPTSACAASSKCSRRRRCCSSRRGAAPFRASGPRRGCPERAQRVEGSCMSRPAPTEETVCNLCGASDYEVVATSDRDGRPLRTVMCRVCGLVWVNPRPSVDDMNAYYATEYRADYTGAAAPPLRKIVRGMLGAHDRWRALRPLLRDGAALVDVGCGAGVFVYLLRRRHVDASGIEPGRVYVEVERQTMGSTMQMWSVAYAQWPTVSKEC